MAKAAAAVTAISIFFIKSSVVASLLLWRRYCGQFPSPGFVPAKPGFSLQKQNDRDSSPRIDGEARKRPLAANFPPRGHRNSAVTEQGSRTVRWLGDSPKESSMRAFACSTAIAVVLAAGIAGAQEQKASPQNAQSPALTEQKANEAAQERKQESPADASSGIDDARGGKGNPTPDQTVGPPDAGPVPLRGDGLDVPGASPETAPAKYSEENAKRDEYSIMGYPLQLSGEQRQAILNAIGERSETASALGQTVHAEAGVFLPTKVEAEELPATLNQQIPEIRGLKYVKTDDNILLVAPASGIVRGVISE